MILWLWREFDGDLNTIEELWRVLDDKKIAKEELVRKDVGSKEESWGEKNLV